MTHDRIKTSLQKHAKSGPASEEEIKALHGAAWHYYGKFMVDTVNPAPGMDDWYIQATINYAEKQFGKRRKPS